MDKKLKISLVLFLFAFVLVSLALTLDKKNRLDDGNGSKNENSGLILFYGDVCPHCKTVEEFLEKNKIDEKVSLERKEIYRNEANKSELIKAATSCGFALDSIGVPFLLNGQECLVGPDNIIDFFKEKIIEKL